MGSVAVWGLIVFFVGGLLALLHLLLYEVSLRQQAITWQVVLGVGFVTSVSLALLGISLYFYVMLPPGEIPLFQLGELSRNSHVQRWVRLGLLAVLLLGGGWLWLRGGLHRLTLLGMIVVWLWWEL